MRKVYGMHARVLPLVILLLIVPQQFAQSSYLSLPTVFSKSSPTIATEKRNYQPNELVDIAGVDFLSYERVRIRVRHLDPNLKQEVLLTQWDAFADNKGQIATDWIVADLGGAGDTFVIEAKGTISGSTSKTEITTLAPQATSVKISQCANSNATPQNLDCPNGGPTGWVTGIVGTSKARQFEGDSIAYRNVMEELVVGNSYKWTLTFDTSKSGLNAIDYLTTYNRTITNANPCQDGATVNGFCTLASPSSTMAIPVDPNVTNGRDTVNGTTDDITQQAGDITAWGATITGVSVPTYTGTFPAGTSTASVDITFTATNATAVLAWGGHISTRTDWGQTFGSVNITGAPYHISNGGLMDLTGNTTCCGGSQDLQLQAAAVTATAKIIIIKHASPPSNFQFNFTTTGLTPGNFSLVDNSSTTDPMQIIDGISTFDSDKTIEETGFAPYVLQSIVCTVDIGTGGTQVGGRIGNAIDIEIQPGDQVTCTFNNDFLTAANVSVAGRVLDGYGEGLRLATVTVTDGNGVTRSTLTNPFGFYTFNDLEAGGSYVFNVRHWSHTFDTRLVNLDDNLTGFDFTPN